MWLRSLVLSLSLYFFATLVALTPDAGLLRLWYSSWQPLSFFESLIDGCVLLKLPGRIWGDFFFLVSLIVSPVSIFVVLYLFRYMESTLLVLEFDWRYALASALTVFSITSSHKSSTRPRTSSWASKEGRKSYLFRQIRLFLLVVIIGTNSF